MNLTGKEFLNIAITLECDCKCKHCYIDSFEGIYDKDLGLQTWKEIFDLFVNYGGREVCFHGGEPLLYENIGEIVYYAWRRGLKTSIISNLINLDRSLIEIFKKTQTYILTSLNGPRENYFQFRGLDKLDLIIENIDLLRKNDLSVHPIHIVHGKNYSDLSWIADFCNSREIKVATLSPLQPIGRAAEIKDYWLSPEELGEFIDTFAQLNRENKKVKFVTQSIFKPGDLESFTAQEKFLKTYNNCYLNILNDGSILPDFDLPEMRNFSLGNITGSPLKLNQKNEKAYRETLDKAFKWGKTKLRRGVPINWTEEVQIAANQKLFSGKEEKNLEKDE